MDLFKETDVWIRSTVQACRGSVWSFYLFYWPALWHCISGLDSQYFASLAQILTISLVFLCSPRAFHLGFRKFKTRVFRTRENKTHQASKSDSLLTLEPSLLSFLTMHFAPCSKFVHLTSLALSSGCLRDPIPSKSHNCVVGLQELLLFNMVLHPSWLRKAFTPLQQLRSLKLHQCVGAKYCVGELNPLDTLQYDSFLYLEPLKMPSLCVRAYKR